MLVSHCLDYCSVAVLKLGSMPFLALFFFKIVFAILGPCISVQILASACQFLEKKVNWYFGRDCVESIDQFGEDCHLNNIESCHPCMSFHLLRSSWIFFNDVL